MKRNRHHDNDDLTTFVIIFLLSLAAVVVASGDGPDIDGDLDVDGADIGQIIGAWGATDSNHPCDLNGDSKVDGSDLGIALGAWSGPGVLWQPVTIDGDRRISVTADIVVPAGAKIVDAETIGGPLWRDIRAFVWADEPGVRPVIVYELPYNWNPDEVERANAIKETTP